MATLPENLIATAEALVDIEPSIGSASLRRAVSTAYYALFSRLSALCASRVARSGPATDSFKAIYRTLEHGQTRKVLTASPEFAKPIAEVFGRLQDLRQWADYSNEPHPDLEKAALGEKFSRTEALQLVELAGQTIATINALSNDSKQRLAVALIARSRR
jgi:hypothetical protein